MSEGVQCEDGHVHFGVMLGPTSSAVGVCILEGESASLGGFEGIACKGEGGRGCGSGRLNLNV
jgi:hypothetical protein